MGGVAQAGPQRGQETGRPVPFGAEGEMELIAPMLAGARARGIADAFEMLGLGSIMLNQSGRVLYVSPRASMLMQDAVSIASDHLVGANADINSSIQSLIESSLTNRIGNPPGIVVASGNRQVLIRSIAVPNAEDASAQLLKVVLSVSIQ